MAELVDGFEFLTKIKDDVTVLGTKSILPGSSYYQAAYEVGKVFGQKQIYHRHRWRPRHYGGGQQGRF